MLLGLDIGRTTDKKGNCRPRIGSSPDTALAGKKATGADPDYSLKKILDAAWNGESRLLLGSVIRQIIQRLPASAEAKEYAMLVKRHDNQQLQGYIMDDFLRKKEMFNTSDWGTIKTAVKQSRWKRFYTVADRLNSPGTDQLLHQ